MGIGHAPLFLQEGSLIYDYSPLIIHDCVCVLCIVVSSNIFSILIWKLSETRQIPGVEVVVDVLVIYSAQSPIFSDRTEYGWIYSGYQNPCHRYSRRQAFFPLTRPRIINKSENQKWKLLNR